MAYPDRKPDVVEVHNTREVVVDRSMGSSGAMLAVVLVGMLVLGLVAYFAWWGPSQATSSNTTIRVDAPAATKAPDVNVAAPNINVSPPDINITTPPPVVTTTGSGSDSTAGTGTTTGQ